LPVQCVTAARVHPPGPGSLWQWLGQLPDPRDPRGVRFSLPCVIAIAMAARLAGCDSFTAAGEWAARRPQRVLEALGCPRHKRARVYVAPSEKTIRRVSGLCDHDLADDLLCGWTGELAAACGVLSPAKVQERRRDKARKARARARKAARRERGARELSQKQARKAARRERKAAAAAVAASAAAVAGGRAKLPAGSACGRVPVPRRTRHCPPGPTATLATSPPCAAWALTAKRPAAPRSKARRRPSIWGSSGTAAG